MISFTYRTIHYRAILKDKPSPHILQACDGLDMSLATTTVVVSGLAAWAVGKEPLYVVLEGLTGCLSLRTKDMWTDEV